MRVLKKEIWPHCITVNTLTGDDVYDIEMWLGECLGAFKGRWNIVYHYSRSDFYFKQGPDATMFMLRWS